MSQLQQVKDAAKRAGLSEELVDKVFNPSFQRSHDDRLRDAAMLLFQISQNSTDPDPRLVGDYVFRRFEAAMAELREYGGAAKGR